jgi:Ca2+:H+ antiporter
VAAALWLDAPLVLGLSNTGMVLLALTFLLSTLTLGAGRTTVLQGAVHLVVGATWLFLVLAP